MANKLSRRQMIGRATKSAATLFLGVSSAQLSELNAGAIMAAVRPGETRAKRAPLLPQASLDYLRDLTRDVVQAARVRPGERRGGSAINSLGITLIMPGGNYPSYWIRDFAMSLDSDFITAEEMLDHLRLTARGQNGAVARQLKNGLVIPPYAIPDHINFDGGAVFYPGTYSSGEDQGNGDYGFLPPIDDHYEFIHIAHRLFRKTGQPGFLNEEINGKSILDRLTKAFDAPEIHSTTGLVVTQAEQRAVGFGFCDSIYFTGNILFPSLLRYRAAGQLDELRMAAGHKVRMGHYATARTRIAKNLVPTFRDPSRASGWLLAATKVGRQPDVWGTLYALHLGVLRGTDARRARQTIAEAVRKGTLSLEGAVRHVPLDRDASSTSAWERAACAHNTYQNGAFWHTPTGWLIEALFPTDRTWAQQVFHDFIQHLRQGDYRLGASHHAPWECFGRNGQAAQNGVYMTSVALPWPIIQSLGKSR